CQHYNDMVPTF
nr:immunoglobulin light chain junction region [Macaca mulatta]